MSAFGFRKPSDLPDTIPLFPLTGVIVLPRGLLSLNVFEPRYLNMVDDTLGGQRLIGMIQPATGEEREAVPSLSDVGTVGRITAFQETGDGRYLISLTGVCRFAFEREVKVPTPYRQALVSYDEFAEDLTPSFIDSIDREELIATLKRYSTAHGYQVEWDAVEQTETETVVNIAAQLCPLDPAAKQALLEAQTLDERAKALMALLIWDVAGDDGQRPVQ
jgi:Lon protease-like protein